MKYILASLFFLISIQTMASNKIFARNSVAISGYDTVAFFMEEKAIKGNSQFQTEWQGVNWFFSSQKNLEFFNESPEKYAPQFGGYCALGAAHFGAVPTNPKAFSIHEGKLYFNMTDEVRITWRLNSDFHIKRAEKAWKENKITFYN